MVEWCETPPPLPSPAGSHKDVRSRLQTSSQRVEVGSGPFPHWVLSISRPSQSGDSTPRWRESAVVEWSVELRKQVLNKYKYEEKN